MKHFRSAVHAGLLAVYPVPSGYVEKAIEITSVDVLPICICVQRRTVRSPCACRTASLCFNSGNEDSNLVDSASSHTLVSKIKPCMCKFNYMI